MNFAWVKIGYSPIVLNYDPRNTNNYFSATDFAFDSIGKVEIGDLHDQSVQINRYYDVLKDGFWTFRYEYIHVREFVEAIVSYSSFTPNKIEGDPIFVKRHYDDYSFWQPGLSISGQYQFPSYQWVRFDFSEILGNYWNSADPERPVDWVDTPEKDPPLFTALSDRVDFNGRPVVKAEYDALGGDDVVDLPRDADVAAAWGFVFPVDGFKGGDGNDSIYAGANLAATIDGGDGADDLYGGLKDDFLFGGDGDDTIVGAKGADTLEGGAGADLLFGDLGADVFRPGAGDDFIYGGGGGDVIEFAAADLNAGGVDRIVDFYEPGVGLRLSGISAGQVAFSEFPVAVDGSNYVFALATISLAGGGSHLIVAGYSTAAQLQAATSFV